MLEQKILEGDRVFDISVEEKGTVERIYPSINVAVVRFPYGASKAKISDLIKLTADTDYENDEDEKKQTLLDKVKARFYGRSYD